MTLCFRNVMRSALGLALQSGTLGFLFGVCGSLRGPYIAYASFRDDSDGRLDSILNYNLKSLFRFIRHFAAHCKLKLLQLLLLNPQIHEDLLDLWIEHQLCKLQLASPVSGQLLELGLKFADPLFKSVQLVGTD